MKQFGKAIVTALLKLFAKVYLWRTHPRVIAIAGSEGKSEIREAVFQRLQLQSSFSLRENSRGYNTEIGLPLAILDEPTGLSDAKQWGNILLSAMMKALFPKEKLDVLVLEFGVDTPGEMSSLLSIVRPDIAVIYCIRPRGFGDEEYMNTLAGEFETLAASAYRTLVNIDDAKVMASVSRYSDKQKTFSATKKEGVDFVSENNESQCEVIAKGSEQILKELMRFL